MKHPHSPEKRMELALQICEAVSMRKTIKSALKAADICHATWHKWRKEDETINALYKKAKEDAQVFVAEHLAELAPPALQVLLTGKGGYEYDASPVIKEKAIMNANGEMVVVERTIETKRVRVLPNAAVAIFVAKKTIPGWDDKVAGENNTETDKPEVGFDLTP